MLYDDMKDVSDDLIFEEEPSIIDETNALDLIETALHLMEDYLNDNPTAITEPDFHAEMLEEIKEMMSIQFEEHIQTSDYVEDEINDIVEEAFTIFIDTFQMQRSVNTDIICEDIEEQADITASNANPIQIQIDYLRSKPQPNQRTDEWYKFRHTLITASNAYKAFGTQSMINQLIYEKCQPLKTASTDDDAHHIVNVNTPFHWGQKYEPLSVLIYEAKYNTKVEDFGCIKHDKYSCIGASPDGINVDPNSDRYGRMLEIKNIVNREIDGNPKKEYWIQMQLQMEVCNLDQCDFLETKFVEYDGYSAYCADTTDKQKGFMMYFTDPKGTPVYVYKPISLIEESEVTKWEDEMFETYKKKQFHWVKNCYWKLDILSCVLVNRNKKWFADNVDTLVSVWNIILEERVTGYEHRAPKKRIKTIEQPVVVQGCLLKMKSSLL
jgi:putative phage-type endonuclease